jgi:hypothetical protein
MSAICAVCVNPVLRGQVDADVIRRLGLSDIGKKHGLSSRTIRRHVGHLPERLEADAEASRPNVYIGTVTYNINLIVSPPEEEDVDHEVDGARGLDPEEEEVLGHA